ncbi:ABC transporter ATP-binding protein [Massilia yuzhufengensis]|uniref:NitT/TauT family transport system ATP-binding protein n=1 Tax=Massilia yuzhufengensis TaxID=1164594 RepID=A0A1I1IEE1_9BURK|nr:ABC transporter ATP-binding protein [Massilia yuzhufengensis]SFC32608.1 NitT/TauT family transport system ATP-binding protein [Massilia yuzhufengensis]
MDAKILVSGVRKQFRSLPVVDGIDLAVAPGEFVAIVGPSGCGKSTLMKLLAGFEHPDSGSVAIDGQAVTRPTPNAIVISQHGSVFPWLTVQENLMFGLSGKDQAAKEASADHYADVVGLKGFEKAYPHELSGGMLKRVEIARALAVKPDILFMDEPFSALDALTALKMRNELLRILREERHTVILITHDVEEAIYLADRVVVLSPRPTTIQSVFAIAQPHPRKVSQPALQEIKDAILGQLGL